MTDADETKKMSKSELEEAMRSVEKWLDNFKPDEIIPCPHTYYLPKAPERALCKDTEECAFKLDVFGTSVCRLYDIK